MPRSIRIAAAQMGATNRWDTREETLNRMLKLLNNAASKDAKLVLFPEIAFTTFFPRYVILDQEELEIWFEHGDIRTSPNTKALFEAASKLGVDICVGFAEATEDGRHYNTCVYYHAATGDILSKYRKIHLPGDVEPLPNAKVSQLEKRYFLPGDLGFQAFRVPGLLHRSEEEQPDPILGMMICNDRRWAESWRVLGLQGVEVVLEGYNTTGYAPELWGQSADISAWEAGDMALFHHKLVLQCHSYTNATFSVSAARCGLDDGQFPLIAGSVIVDPEGRIIAESQSTGDEIVIADCDLELCQAGKRRTFDFARHRRVEHYERIVTQSGVIEPPLLHQITPQVTATEPTSNPARAEEKHNTKYRILLINPNSSKFMTDDCVQAAQPTLPPDVALDGFTTPPPAPAAIESTKDALTSATTALSALQPTLQENRYSAYLVACYSDHPLIPALREEVANPVIGIMEASLFAARTLGSRFGIVASSERSVTTLTDAVREYGFSGFCAGVRSCGLGVLGLKGSDGGESESGVLRAVNGAAREVVGEGADTVLLGCAGMTRLKEAVEVDVGRGVVVVDGVVAGVHHLVGLLRMGGRTARKGVYSSARAKREARKEDSF